MIKFFVNIFIFVTSHGRGPGSNNGRHQCHIYGRKRKSTKNVTRIILNSFYGEVVKAKVLLIANFKKWNNKNNNFSKTPQKNTNAKSILGSIIHSFTSSRTTWPESSSLPAVWWIRLRWDKIHLNRKIINSSF